MGIGTAQTATVEGVSRLFTLRKVVLVVLILVALKSVWTIFQSYRGGLQPLTISDAELDQDFVFKPKSCVMEDGICKPFSEAKDPIPVKGLTAHGHNFYFNGLPIRILSGSFHYFRTHPAQWLDRLLKMKAAGLNTVTTYIPWNLHEKKKHEFKFSGFWDIASFVRQVQNAGLYLIVRPGPYICSEWEFGGLPSWLLSDPEMQVRTSAYRPYLEHVRGYFSKLFPLLASFMYSKGGPIIAFQVENELGSYSNDPEYMRFLVDMFQKYSLDNELLFTSDGSEQLANGSYHGILSTVNFAKNPGKHLDMLKSFQPNKPLMVTEFWCGWFDHWGEPEHHTFKVLDLEDTLTTILRKNASINFYMFVGGTNFEFWNGANNGSEGYAPTVTSYDYDAPISENGDITPKYMAIRKTIKRMKLGPMDFPAIPDNTPKKSYGTVKIAEYLAFNDLIKLTTEQPIRAQFPQVMELLDVYNGGGQGYGFLLYRTTFTEGEHLSFDGSIFDLALIMVNGKPMVVTDWTTSPVPEAKIPQELLRKSVNTLEILVENCGRVNFKWKGNDPNILSTQRKGIVGNVYLDDVKLMNWEHVVLDFSEQFRQVLRSTSSWRPFYPQKIPTVYRSFFTISETPVDTHLNMEYWTKGVVIVNGFLLGRYWNIGPQSTLYVPAPLLVEGHNELIIFELDKANDQLELVDYPNL